VGRAGQALGLGAGNVGLFILARVAAVLQAPAAQVLGYMGDGGQGKLGWQCGRCRQ
jgi:hypothetical protein